MGGGLAFEDENADKGGEGVQKGQFFADILFECPLFSLFSALVQLSAANLMDLSTKSALSICSSTHAETVF